MSLHARGMSALGTTDRNCIPRGYTGAASSSDKML
jgi:hypothetical protein